MFDGKFHGSKVIVGIKNHPEWKRPGFVFARTLSPFDSGRYITDPENSCIAANFREIEMNTIRKLPVPATIFPSPVQERRYVHDPENDKSEGTYTIRKLPGSP